MKKPTAVRVKTSFKRLLPLSSGIDFRPGVRRRSRPSYIQIGANDVEFTPSVRPQSLELNT